MPAPALMFTSQYGVVPKGSVRESRFAAATAASQHVAQYTGDARLLSARLDELRAAYRSESQDTIQQKFAKVQAAAYQCKAWNAQVSAWCNQLDEELIAGILEIDERVAVLLRVYDLLQGAGIGMKNNMVEDTQSIHAAFRMLETSLASSCLPDTQYAEECARLKEQIACLQTSLAAATDSLQAIQTAHKAEVASLEARKESELLGVKAAAVKRVKHLMQEIEDLKTAGCDATPAAIDVDSRSSAQSDATCGPQDPSEETQGQSAEILQQVQDLELQLEEQQLHAKQEKAELTAQLADARATIEKQQLELHRLQTTLNEATCLRDDAQNAVQEAVHLRAELRRESLLRKRAHNELRELKGNIRVLCRVRPAAAGAVNAHLGDIADGDGSVVAVREHDEYTVCLDTISKNVVGKETMGVRKFEFDSILGEEATQAQVYSEVRELIQSAHDGFNVCVFCYGQTGSGKTYTMRGTEGNSGILPRAAVDVFAGVGDRVALEVRACVLELYQENLVDLLAEPGNGCKLIPRTDEKGLVYVEGAVMQQVDSAEALEATFELALSRRATAATNLNAESSRSHLVCMLRMRRRDQITGTTVEAKLSFVDLAGSERVSRSGALDGDKARFDEARAINKSLSALGDVISSLTSGEKFVPYRNHKLTELMRDSLGGSAKTLMVVNVSPLSTDAAESKNSLEYAQRVKEVTNENSRNFETAEIAKLKAEIDRLKTRATVGSVPSLPPAPTTPGVEQ